MYIHLHGHSHYSLLEAIGQIQPLIHKTKELWFDTIALTDYHGMYGIMEFYTKANKQGIKPICGIELTVTHTIGRRPQGDQFITLIAENYEWYLNLLKITTLANTKWHDGVPTIDYQTLKELHSWLLCIIWSPRSVLGYTINQGREDEIKRCIETMSDIFGDTLYLEITAQSYTLEPALRPLNDQIISLSQTHHLPVIVSTNFHYINKSDHRAYEVALAIKDQTMMSDDKRRKIKGEYYIMSEWEVFDILINNWYWEKQIEELFATNQWLSDRVNLQLPKMTPKFPKYKNTPEMNELYERFQSHSLTK